MKRTLALSLTGATLSLVACVVTPGEPTALDQDTVALSCPQGQYPFNGACRDTCATTAGCAAGLRCMRVTNSVNACLDESMGCAYLGSDTQCIGIGGYYLYGGGRGGPATSVWATYASDPPNADPARSTPHKDESFSFTEMPYGSYAGAYATAAGCEGDAQWIAVPVANGAPVACDGTHAVTRCRQTGAACQLVGGITREAVAP
jgi:hypothetical protein